MAKVKGIILAGGTGSRLFPLTIPITKQLLPIYDKPMIYYPLSVLMLAGIRDILIITTPEDQSQFKKLLGTGKQFGISLSYAIQDKPRGIAEAFIVGETFINQDNVCLILGDNIFYGEGFPYLLRKSFESNQGATIFGYRVKDPERYGVAEINKKKDVLSIEEKPTTPKSSYAVTGIYVYDHSVVSVAKSLQPSGRGELEITDVNLHYLKEKKLKMELLGRGTAWLDTGTHESMLEASQFVQVLENRQGLKIACLEEIAYELGYITKEDLKNLAQPMIKNQYGQYLMDIVNHS